MPGRAPAETGRGGHLRVEAVGLGSEHLGRLEPRQLRAEPGVVRDFGEHETPARDVRPGEPEAALAARERQHEVVAPLLEQRLVAQRARGDDARDAALDQALGLRRVADLLADRDRLAQPRQPRQIPLERVVGHARHRIGSPAEEPRCVSVMSSSRAALRASS
jgi:hypothetical protein